MSFEKLAIPEVILVKPRKFGDDRGFFAETYHAQRYKENGIEVDFVQDNHSLSRPVGVLRGLHFQSPPFAQDKLVRCTRGRILDVAVDIRDGSPTYGEHVSAELTADNGWQLFVPKGFAHGFVTLEADTEVQYKVSEVYAPENDHGLAWNDPALSIDWQVEGDKVTLSDKDRKHPYLANLPSYFSY